MFGFSPAPSFCATLTAEILLWITALGIVAIAMTDDFLVVSNSEFESRQDMDKVVKMLQPCGFVFAQEKFQLAKQVFLFIGFVIDTNQMTVSFHPHGVRAYLCVLKDAVKTFRAFKTLPRPEVESLAGKLNNYAALIQRGRIHVHQLWRLAHRPHLVKVNSIRARIIDDLMFWVATLESLASDGQLPRQFPIISAEEVKESNDMVLVVRSDASGQKGESPDEDGGWGYLAGGLNDSSPKYEFGRWYGKYQFGAHSHAGELTVLLIFLERSYKKYNVHASSTRLIFWVTDCSAAALSVNKGNCKSDESLEILKDILSFCDRHAIWIVALWWPREQGALEDFLTHLSSYINRDFGEGSIEDLGFLAHNAKEGKGGYSS